MRRTLRNRREFERVYSLAEKRVGRLLVLYLLQSDGDADAVVASGKIGKAVQRNRAKRLLREALRAVEAPSLSSARPVTGIWRVAVARRAILGCGFQDVHRELVQLAGDQGMA